MEHLRPETAIAIGAVERSLVMAQKGTGQIRFKDERDVVTDADVAIEDFIRATVEDAQGIPVVGEERGGEPDPDHSYWLVDPICGTRNFASGMSLFSINMALVERGEIVIAVVGNGATGEIHVSEQGHGARTRSHNGWRRLKASADSRIVVLEAWPAPGLDRERAARLVASSIRADRWDIRSFATSLTLAYLAEGRVAASIHFSSPALHVGAGALLAAEAGACVTDLDGRPWTVGSASLLASASGELQDDLLELFHSSEAQT